MVNLCGQMWSRSLALPQVCKTLPQLSLLFYLNSFLFPLNFHLFNLIIHFDGEIIIVSLLIVYAPK